MQNELYHHGIKGQRWGVRRYQNEDGTLTDYAKKLSKTKIVKNINKKLESNTDHVEKLSKTKTVKNINKKLGNYAKKISKTKTVKNINKKLESKLVSNLQKKGLKPVSYNVKQGKQMTAMYNRIHMEEVNRQILINQQTQQMIQQQIMLNNMHLGMI